MIITLRALTPIIRVRGYHGERVVFTNGCFDILHAGHVDYLEKASRLGDILVVAMNSDKSVRSIKEPGRPILDEAHRAAVLNGLKSVDYVVLFDEPDPLHVVVELMPDVMVKGADWKVEDIIGAKEVMAEGGRVELIAHVYDLSTTEIIRRAIERFGQKEEYVPDGRPFTGYIGE